MRARNIKPGFFDNEILGELPPLTRLLFIGLWCMADKEGRLQDRPKRIRKELLGYDDLKGEDVDRMLQELEDSGFILRYEAYSQRYISVINFLKHQSPHSKEAESIIPPPGEGMGLDVGTESPVKMASETAGLDSSQDLHTCQAGEDEHQKSMVQAPEKHQPSTNLAPEKHPENPSDSLIPDSLIPGKKNMVVDEPTTVGLPHPKTGKKGQKRKSPTRENATTWLETSFCIFWETFPGDRRLKKEDCWKAWGKIKPDKGLLDRMLKGIEQGKKSRAWQNGYIPQPLTWLHERGWEETEKEKKNDTRNKNTGIPRRDGDFSTGFKEADY